MRCILGHKEGYCIDIGFMTRLFKHETTVRSYFCANCGTESVGVIANYSERNPDGNRGRDLSDYYSKAFDYTRKMLDDALIENCPMCGKPIKSEKGFFKVTHNFRNNDSLFSDSDFDEIFEKMKAERQETYNKVAQDIIATITEKANEKYHKSDLMVPKTAEITASTQTLLPYIVHLMQLEFGLYAVQQNLVELYCEKSELRETILTDYQKKIEEIHGEIDCLEGEKEELEEEHDSFVAVPEPQIDYPTKPQKPQEPRFTEPLPKEPIYKTAGLFNKKKVAAENEAKKKAYESDLERYKQRQSAYQTELEKYKKELAQFEEAQAAWSVEVEAIKTKAQTDYQVAVAQKEAEYTEKLSELNEKLQALETKNKQIIDGLAAGDIIDSQAGMIFFSEEISDGEKLLESIVAARNEMYSYNVIYPKYRNLVAISSFYDYLMSGRCNTLVGNDGAYNLYESESRADLIITKLSDVLTSLDKIQDNQYMLYQQMSDVNKGVNALNESMKSVVSSLAHIATTGDEMKNYLRSIHSDTSSISTNVKSISENTEITAHYSKVSAFYAKRNAELTDALGYMTAFK